MSRSLVSGRKISPTTKLIAAITDRVPQARIDVAGRRHDGEHGGRQEAAEPAVADVIGQRQPAIADAGREQLDQPRGDRPVHHGHIDDQDDEQQHRHRIVDVVRVGACRIAVGLDRGGDGLGDVRRIGGDGLVADLHARLGAGRRGDVVVVHRQTDQRGFDDVAAGGVLLDAGRLELERAFGRIGRDRHRRTGERRFQLRIGEVGDALEDRRSRSQPPAQSRRA